MKHKPILNRFHLKTNVINKYCNNKTGFIANMEIAPNLWRIVYDDGKGEDFEEQLKKIRKRRTND
jgi:hypothetical protein